MIIKIDDIKVSQRLRELDDTKVYDLMESIQLVGLLHPIVIDSDNKLLAGNHRLEAYRILGRDTIECKKVNLSELENELVQIDENLILNQLSILEMSEHLIRREEILTKLGKRATVRDNQYAGDKSDTSTTKELATELSLSERKYQRIKQIYKINYTTRQILKDTEIANNLDVLLQIERLQDDSVQIEVATRIESGYSGNIRELIENIRNGLGQREEEDFYPTHPSITQMLLDREKLEGTIWEPACGEGDMSEVLIKEGYDVLSTDLIDRGYGEGGIDFLDDDQIRKFGEFDNIVTNPPFKLGIDFVLQSKKIARKKICVFNKTSFLEGVGRYDMWIDKEFPLKNMYQFSSRVPFSKNEVNDQSYSGMISFSWFVFEKGYVGKPTIDWIPPIRIPKPNER